MDDFGIYLAHALCWATFGIVRAVARRGAAAEEGPKNDTAKVAPWSRALLGFHMAGFGLLYFGLGNAVFGHRVPELFAFQRLVGGIAIAGAAALMSWALLYFRSWRFRAALDASHELATGGPFRFVRHPIYVGLALFGIGTALWVPTPIVIAGAIVMLIAGDLRARAEERLLVEAFGDRYRDYMTRTKRSIPGLY